MVTSARGASVVTRPLVLIFMILFFLRGQQREQKVLCALQQPFTLRTIGCYASMLMRDIAVGKYQNI